MLARPGELCLLEQGANKTPGIGTPFRSELEAQLAQLKVPMPLDNIRAFYTRTS
jgi:hypothetical protein